MEKVTSARCQSSQSITPTTPASVMTSAISGKSPSAPPISDRWSRAASHKRTTSLRSNARPRRSSNSWPTSGTRDLLLELLDPPEARVEPACADEVLVPSLLHDTSGVQHHDTVGELRRAQPVGHQEHRASLGEGA